MSSGAVPPFPLNQAETIADANGAAAATDAGAGDNSKKHATTTPLNPMMQAHLTSYLRLQTTKDAYTHATKPLLSARRDLVDATRALTNLKRPHKHDKILPPSLSIDTLAKITLPKVGTTAPEVFFADELAQIKAAVVTAETAINAILIKAREREVQHHTNNVTAATFLVAARETYHADCLLPYVTKFRKDPAVAGLEFPVEQALSHFSTALQERIGTIISDSVASSMAGDKQKQQRQEADAVAQEQIMQGAATGDTIKQLASQTVIKEVAALRKEIREELAKFKHTLGQSATSGSASSSLAPSANDDATTASSSPRVDSKRGSQQSRQPAPTKAMTPVNPTFARPPAHHGAATTSPAHRNIGVTPRPHTGNTHLPRAPTGPGNKRTRQGTSGSNFIPLNSRPGAASVPFGSSATPGAREHGQSTNKSQKPFAHSTPHRQTDDAAGNNRGTATTTWQQTGTHHAAARNDGRSDRDRHDNNGRQYHGGARQREYPAAASTNSSGGDRPNSSSQQNRTRR